jgi:hypothetical protein
MAITNHFRAVITVLALALAAVLLVLVGLRTEPAQAQSSNEGDTECVGTLPPGIYYGNVVVPEGQSCTIQGSEVRGNVLVREGGRLLLQRSTVRGDAKAVADGVIISVADDSTVLGNVEVLRNSFLSVEQNTLRGTSPDGALLGLRGDVKAGENSFLGARDSTILGNVVGDKANRVDIIDFPTIPGASVVGKNFVHKEGAEGFVRICGTTVEDGNIEIEKLGAHQVFVGDEAFCSGFGRGNTVLKGDIKVWENTIRALGVDQNRVPQGNVQVFKNVGEGPKTVQFNTVGKDLQCFENTPPFLGRPNVATKAERQCFATPAAP